MHWQLGTLWVCPQFRSTLWDSWFKKNLKCTSLGFKTGLPKSVHWGGSRTSSSMDSLQKQKKGVPSVLHQLYITPQLKEVPNKTGLQSSLCNVCRMFTAPCRLEKLLSVSFFNHMFVCYLINNFSGNQWTRGCVPHREQGSERLLSREICLH